MTERKPPTPRHSDGDPLEQLRRRVTEAQARMQYRVSVSPATVLRLFRERDEALADLGRRPDRPDPVEHSHRRSPGWPLYVHEHPRGEIPHGHHGMRYGAVTADTRPVVEL